MLRKIPFLQTYIYSTTTGFVSTIYSAILELARMLEQDAKHFYIFRYSASGLCRKNGLHFRKSLLLDTQKKK